MLRHWLLTFAASAVASVNPSCTSETQGTVGSSAMGGEGAMAGTPSAGECEPGSRRECWEDGSGNPLPELSDGVQGACRLGDQHCSGDGSWAACEGAVGPAAADSCEVAGADENCNGIANEECACSGSEQRACGTDVGNCVPGTQTCDGTTWSDCEGGVVAQGRDSCAIADDDADCNGVPNEDCDCVGAESEACGACGTRTCVPEDRTWGNCTGGDRTEQCWETEEGEALPGSQPETPLGNCRLGERTCGSDGEWTSCSGAVGPEAADSCEAPGDDANCNGTPNEECACTVDSQCDDGFSCTEDACTDGTCSHEVSSAFCLIQGQCVSHNSNDPSNECRYCDAGINQVAWTNWPGNTECDDGKWCNGEDTCNGSGQCISDFPSGRCNESGPCAKSSCDEAGQTCYEPTTVSCQSNLSEQRCFQEDTCDVGVAQSRGGVRYCDGTSAGCNGNVVWDSNWTDDETCGEGYICNSSNNNCTGRLDCVAWCDNGVCWHQDPPGTSVTWQEATDYCESGDWAGRTGWRLPTAREWIAVFRGCQNGTSTGNLAESSCSLACDNEYDCNSSSGCASCTSGAGPDDDPVGCYWRPELDGTCQGRAYWTATVQAGSYYWQALPAGGYLFPPHMGSAGSVRCVVDQ